MQSLPLVASYPTTVIEYQSPDVKNPKPSQPASTNQDTAQSGTKKYAWVLVDTIINDGKESIEITNKRGIYQEASSAAPGSYTFSSKYIGKTDTYPDPDQISGEGYSMKLDISVPPTVIKAGDVITLSFNLAFTGQNISYFDGTGSCRADLESTRFVNKTRKNFFQIYCSVKYSSKNVMSVSDTITATAPAGTSEGKRIKLWTGGLSAYIGTTYVYEWKAE